MSTITADELYLKGQEDVIELTNNVKKLATAIGKETTFDERQTNIICDFLSTFTDSEITILLKKKLC